MVFREPLCWKFIPFLINLDLSIILIQYQDGFEKLITLYIQFYILRIQEVAK